MAEHPDQARHQQEECANPQTQTDQAGLALMFESIAVDLFVGGIARGHVEHAVRLRIGALIGQHLLKTTGLGGGKIARLAGIGLEVEEPPRSEEHTSELRSLLRTSYAAFCLKKK